MIAMIDHISTEDLGAAYRETATMVDTDSRKVAKDVYDAWLAGDISDAEFRDSLLTVLIVTGVSARAAGENFAAALMGELPAGSEISDEHLHRLGKAAATMTATLDVAQDIGPRVGRLVAGEALSTLQQSVVDGYARHGVGGYTRGLSAKACELCVWLYKDGYVYPTGQPMHKHPGCTCVPIPTR